MTTTPPVTITPVTTASPSLMVATPLYDGAQADYLRSVVGLAGAAERRGLPCSLRLAQQQCGRSTGRATCCRPRFLQSDATHLMFVDGDIGFGPEEVLDLLTRMQSDDRLAVIGAPCPKRRINWSLVASAAAKGLGRADPSDLEKYSGIFALDPLDPQACFRVDEPLNLPASAPD